MSNQMEVNFIVTCFSRDKYVSDLVNIFKSYTRIKPNFIIGYNGRSTLDAPHIKIDNRGYQQGDIDLTLAGFNTLKTNGCTRFIKIGADCWLLDDSKIVEIFNKMEEQQACYGGNWWVKQGYLSSDIFFVDTRFGNIFDLLKLNVSYENTLGRIFDSNIHLKKYIIPERGVNGIVDDRGPFRWRCAELNWTMSHNYEDNLRIMHEFFKTRASEVNIIITCFNREAYLPGMIKAINSYSRIKPNYAVAYDGTDFKFPCQVRIDNPGHQRGDMALTIAGYNYLKANCVPRWIKVGIDSWLTDDNKLFELFERMEREQAGYAGIHWCGGGELSTDIFFVDTRYGDVFEELEHRLTTKTGLNGNFERIMSDCVKAKNVKPYIIPERKIKDHRWKCDELGWTMSHTLKDNEQFVESRKAR